MRAAASASQTVEFGKEWLGQTVDGRYPLQEYLGGDNDTGVFLTCLPADTKTKAAIKLVRAGGVEAEALLSNWKRAAQLSHPHLLRIFDGGRCWLSSNELLYVVSEFADENLAQVVPQRALQSSEADSMLRPTLSALAYLHDQGLVHAHLHPGNVMAVGDQLKLSSDRIQRSGPPSRRSPASEYDAPELSAGQLSPSTDVWSLGVMLLESLTQRTSGAKSDVNKVAAPYGEIVRRSLVKDPSARWTVRDIAASLHLQLPPAKVSKPVEPQAPKVGKVEARRVTQDAPATGRGSRRISTLILFLGLAAILAITLTVKLLNQGSVPASQRHASADLAVTSNATSPGSATSPEASANGGNKAGVVVQQVMPAASAGALRTIQGHIKVRLQLNTDAAGNVSEARFVSAGPSKYFSRLSMEAARQWKFAPPVNNGQPSASEWKLLFEFSRGGVKVVPEQVEAK
jgi:TonB family protein